MFENSLVRVMEVFIPPGDATLLHTHAHDIVCVTLSNASTWSESEIGERRESSPAAGRVASTRYRTSPRAHRVGNRGTTPYRLFCLEILNPATGASAEPLVTGNPSGFTTVLEDENVIAYRIQLRPGEGTGRHVYRRPGVFVRLPDGASEWIEQGADRELRNPEDARADASVVAIVLK